LAVAADAKTLPAALRCSSDASKDFTRGLVRWVGYRRSQEVHEESAGDMVTRPWGERSFYVKDPWGNGLCFVDEKTIYTGR
jgi:hypothetical protein